MHGGENLKTLAKLQLVDEDQTEVSHKSRLNVFARILPKFIRLLCYLSIFVKTECVNHCMHMSRTSLFEEKLLRSPEYFYDDLVSMRSFGASCCTFCIRQQS